MLKNKSKLINKKKINGIDLGDRGIYDTRNVLNELTGKEWIYFTNSIWITGYSPTEIENVGLKFRKIHPSPKPPGLIKDIILFFSKSNALIFDPFVGVGGTLLGAALAGGGRKAIGFDLENKYKKAYIKACRSEKLQEMEYVVGDSCLLLESKKVFKNQKLDLIIADPPYSDMIKRQRTGQKVKLYNIKEGSPYSNRDEDLGNMNKQEFLIKLKEILGKSVKHLKENKYLIVFCKDFQPKDKDSNMLHCDVVSTINSIDGLCYKGMRIWHDQAMSLYPFGYPYSFVMNQIHQYVLIFRKDSNVIKK